METRQAIRDRDRGTSDQGSLADPQANTTLYGWITTSLVLIGRRNDLIHSFYMPPDGDRPLTWMKATTRGGRWKARSEPIDLDSLTETADLLAEGLDVADLIVQQLVAECPEWHDPAAPPAS